MPITDFIHRVGLQGLRTLPPERAHLLSLRFLPFLPAPADGRPLEVDPITIAGLRFPNRLGVAAGFDKNAEVFDHLFRWGFGAVEVGTVTPRPQAGNPRPRVFRLREDHGVVNRLGFNNEGHRAAAKRLERRSGGGVVGVNLGCNKDSPDPAADYVAGVQVFAGLADYVTVNLSSPNTPGLRDLQHASSATALVGRVMEARERVTGGGNKLPVFVKLAPDLDEAALTATVNALVDAGVEGLILTNTTISRPAGLVSRNRGEAGGLSGRPLFELATAKLRSAAAVIAGRCAVIGVGGLEDAAGYNAKRYAGADLTQCYTAMIYRGLGLARSILLAPSAHKDLPQAA